MKRSILFAVALFTLSSGFATKKIALSELEDKIAGAWVGQMIGNFYGLPFENKFIENPGPETWPYGYTKNLDKLKKLDGGFSDDDTDFEYLYLIQMEKYGCEPTYDNLRTAWMNHVKDRVWLANRAALGAMHHGLTPPFTGKKELNPHWYQIDPQLINEIWGYTAPGMVTYAAQKSDWAARITSDDWASHPTIHYGAMYANAFFETNREKLVLDALKQLPADSRYAQTVREVVALWKQYPNDWKKARQVIADRYYTHEPEMTKTIWNANLNGACGILSLLYGHGDFQLTMDLGCAMGFDADNQTATIGGLLGVMYGFKALPRDLYLPIEGWTKPFNNKYINITRDALPDAAIDDMVKRTVKQAIDVVCLNGGKLVEKADKSVLVINDKAQFKVPLEFYIGPNPQVEVNKPFAYDYFCDGNQKYAWNLKNGTLPKGVTFNNGTMSGTPTEVGKFHYTLTLSDGKNTIEKEFDLIVRHKNIAPEAKTILANVMKLNRSVLDSCWYTFGKPMYADSVAVINDGVLGGEGSVFYTLAAKARIPKIDFLGYEWDATKQISAVGLHMGCLEEFGGWFTNITIQYRNKLGQWVSVPAYKSYPKLPDTDIVFFQPHFVEYYLEFEPVETTAIRLLFDTKVEKHWHKYTKNVSAFLSVTELSVY